MNGELPNLPARVAALAQLLTLDASQRATAGIRIALKDQARHQNPTHDRFSHATGGATAGGAANGAKFPRHRGAADRRDSRVGPALDFGAWPGADAALGALEYVVVDVETTGGAAGRGHRITEVAALRVRADGAIVDEFATLVNPERPIPPFITALTNISSAMVADAPRFVEVAERLHTLLNGAVFVAHNAPFDWRFVSAELDRAHGPPLTGRMLCTVRMARRLVPEMRRRSLDALSYYFGVANAARHRAHGDARATAAVFRRLLERAEEREVRSWAELEQLLARRPPRTKRRASPSPVPDA